MVLRPHGVFITGTDTGVGKTFVAKGIVNALRAQGYKVAAMKPIVTGSMNDVNKLGAENIYAFKAPLAPSVAGRLENKRISIEKILSAYKKLCNENDFVVVEGIGGLLVPIKKGYFVSDLIKDMDIPAIIVARPGLGTINHTLLTVKHAQNVGIKVLGIIFNEAQKTKTGICERTNPKEIERESGVPILGYVKYTSLRGAPNGRRSNLLDTRRLLRSLRSLAMTNCAAHYESIDKQYIWHPFTQMQDWQKSDNMIIEEAKGCYLKDTSGKWYLDGVSSLWVNVHGHRKKELDEALLRQANKVSHSTLLGLGNTPSIELAKMLVEIAPKGLNKVFYSDSGSTAVEIALKIAFQYWQQKGKVNKTKFVSFGNAYHGDTIGSVSVGGIDLFHKKYKPLLFKAIRSPVSAKELKEILEKQHGKIAAVIIEPLVQAAAGMLMQPAGFLKKVRQLCAEYNCLMIADEVATGFGRTGKMFACEHENVSPDIMTVAKSITGGYLPLAGTLATDEIYDAFCGEYAKQKTFFHGHTYTGNPLACAVAIENLKLYKKEKILEKLQFKISFLKRCLAPFWDLKYVGDIRQKGFMVGIELEPYDWKEKIGVKVAMKARERGVIIRPLGNVIVLMPPLSISKQELKNLLDVTYWAIQDITSKVKRLGTL